MQKVIFQFAVEPELINGVFLFLASLVFQYVAVGKAFKWKRGVILSFLIALSAVLVFISCIGFQFKYDLVIDFSKEIAFLKLRGKDFGYVALIPLWMYLWQFRAPTSGLKTGNPRKIIARAAAVSIFLAALLKIFELTVTERLLFL